MDNPGYIGLTRLSGLADELRAVANNIANMSTTGYRGEGLVFAEVLSRMETDGGALSMAQPRAHVTDPSPGGFTPTGGALDLAIEGDGYFQVETPAGPRLTRAGAFSRSDEGLMVTPQGWPVLDEGGAPIALPPDLADIAVAADGTISADGQPVARVGLVAADPMAMLREDGVVFRVDGEIEPAEDARIAQGFLEDSNVDPMAEMARLIEVQRAYEMGQSFMDMEDQRLRESVRTLGRTT